MKKFIRIMTVLALIGVMLFSIVGCGQRYTYVLPSIAYENESNITIELIADDGTVLFDESMGKGDKYECGSFAWIIKKNGNQIGWIMPNYTYGNDDDAYGFVYSGDKFEEAGIILYLMGEYTEEDFMSIVDVTISKGSITYQSFIDCGKTDNGKFRDYVSASYKLDFSELTPEDVKNAVITISIHE